RIIDQCAEPSLWSKAQVLHSRSLEVFEDMGVVAEMFERGKPMHAINLYTPDGKCLVRFEVGESDTAFTQPLSLSQRETELILAGHLRKLGAAVEREVKLVHFTQGEAGVTAELAHADGRTEEVKTNWLLGCDGSHSTTRKVVGLELAGETYESRITQAD